VKRGRTSLRVLVLAGLSLVSAFGQTVIVSPSSLSLGNQALGTSSSSAKVILKNGQTTSITINRITSSLEDFASGTDCPKKLDAGSSCTISLTFTPQAFGLRTATLTVWDTGSNSPETVTLRGRGVPAVTATPSNLSFGPQALGVSSAAATITVTNNQRVKLTISSIATNLADFTDSSNCPLAPNKLAPGASCTVSVVFTPAVAGTRSATLTITDNANVSPTISLTGLGIIPVTAAPSSLSFAGQAVGTTSASQSVTFTNNQASALTITSINTSIQDFAFTSQCPISPATLAAGANCTTSVAFSPQTTGSWTGTLSFTDNAAGSPQSVTLSGTGTPATLVSIAITPANATFPLGVVQQLTATGTYTDGSTRNLTSTAAWATGNPTIATVNAQGLATSVQPGSTSVTATSGAITGSTTLNVSPAALVSIAVTPAIPSTPLGITQQFTATGTFTDGSTQNLTQTVQWSSSSATVATISNTAGSQGLAQTIGTGLTTITATSSSGITGNTSLTVTAAALVSLAVTPPNPSIALGTTQQFTATGTFTDGSTQNLTANATWASSTITTATISTTGLATSVGMGTATISASSGTIAGSTALTVTAATLVSIAINPPTASVPVGVPQQFTATGTYTDGTTQDLTQSGNWTSSTMGVATISDAAGTMGLASTLAAGSTMIGISASGVNAPAATLTVTPAALVSIAISPQSATIPLGTTQQFTATGTYTDDSTQDVTSTVTWTSSSAQVAIISPSGLATSAGVGTTNITALLGTVSASTSLAVGQPAIAAITISPSSASLPVGLTQQFTATATYTNGSTQDITQSCTWASSAPVVATVNSSGLATGVGIGSANISATSTTSGTVATSVGLTVVAPVPVALAISPLNPSAYVSTVEPFTATLTNSDGSTQNATNAVTWSSSNQAVATVNASGQTIALAPGTTMIAASAGSFTASTTLSVSAPSVSVIPATVSLVLGATEQFVASIPGISNQDVTWSLAGAGTVTTNGLYTAPSVCNTSALSVMVTATSVASPSSSGSAVVTIPPSTCSLPPPTQGNAYCAAGDVPQFGNNDGPAELPQSCYYTALAATPSPGTVYTVTDVASWNSAWAALACGDIIQIPAGTAITAATSAGLSIPTTMCNADNYITVETSAVANLPAEGNRLTPCYAGIPSLPGRPSYPCSNPVNYMAQISAAPTAGASTEALTIGAQTSFLRFIGIEFTRSSGNKVNTRLVNLDAGGINHIIFDRIWAHGNTTDETTRFTSLDNTSYFALIDSTLTDFWCVSIIGACTDAQAVLGGANNNAGASDNTWKVVDNFMEGAAETIELGGGAAVLTPTDIEIRQNHMFKPLTWNPADPSYNGGISGYPVIVKNAWEAKNAERVLLEANVFEDIWAGFTQAGEAVTLTPKSQSPGNECPTCSVTNITVRYNSIHNAAQAFQIGNGPSDSGFYAQAGNSYNLHDNVADGLLYSTCYSCSSLTATVELVEGLNPPSSDVLQNVFVNHNTFVYVATASLNGHLLLGGAQGSTGLEINNITYTNNIILSGKYGTLNAGGGPPVCSYEQPGGAAMINACWNPYTFGGNTFVANGSISWPGTNCAAATSYNELFVNYAGGDYHVAPTSACSLTGNDGLDPGANIDLMNSLTAGVP